MAASALVATADGDVSFGERVRLDQILETLEALKVYDPHDGVDLFRDYPEAILESPKEGHAAAVQILRDAEIYEKSKQLIVRICCAISEINEIDGSKALEVQIEIVSLCALLGVDPAGCGLYTDGESVDILKSPR
jgi:tellurite resistance protein TerB